MVDVNEWIIISDKVELLTCIESAISNESFRRDEALESHLPVNVNFAYDDRHAY